MRMTRGCVSPHSPSSTGCAPSMEGLSVSTTLPRFVFDDVRIPLMDPQRGIRKPRQLDAALSFRTVHAARPDKRPYDDEPGPDNFLRYMWRGTDPAHPENVAMRRARERRLPLVWFHGVAPGVYLPIYPVELVAEEPALHRFVVALDADQALAWSEGGIVDLSARRRYAERTVMERLHQPLFRARVLHAVRAEMHDLPARPRRAARRRGHCPRHRGRRADCPERPLTMQDPPCPCTTSSSSA